jgi:hypothetical protein
MSATILELFNQDDMELIFEALEHRRRYYENKIPQQRINAGAGSVKSHSTLQLYKQKVASYERIIAIWAEESI